MIARRGRTSLLLFSLGVCLAVLALLLASDANVWADPGVASGETRFLTFDINQSAVPSWVVSRELTYRVKVGTVSSVDVAGDGSSVATTYDAANGRVMFTSAAAHIALVLHDSTSDPATIGKIDVMMLRDNKRWALSMTFDDGYLSAYQYGTSYLDKYGYTGGIAMNGRSLDNPNYADKYYMNDAQMLDVIARGWGIFNHTYSHYYVNQFATTTAALNDVKNGRDRVVEGGVDVVDLEMQGEARGLLQRRAMLGEGVGQHQRPAVDHQVDVHVAALVVGRHAHDFPGAERVGVELGRLGGIADRKIGAGATEDGRLDGRGHDGLLG